MLNSSFLFDHLSPLQRDHIYKVMKLRDTKANEIVIKEGDLGDEMYVVDRYDLSFNLLVLPSF